MDASLTASVSATAGVIEEELDVTENSDEADDFFDATTELPLPTSFRPSVGVIAARKTTAAKKSFMLMCRR
jgi:hypothetical protein